MIYVSRYNIVTEGLTEKYKYSVCPKGHSVNAPAALPTDVDFYENAISCKIVDTTLFCTHTILTFEKTIRLLINFIITI